MKCITCNRDRPLFGFRSKVCIYCARVDKMRPKRGSLKKRKDKAKIGRTSVATPLAMDEKVECEACGVEIKLGEVEEHMIGHRKLVEATWFEVHTLAGGEQ